MDIDLAGSPYDRPLSLDQLGRLTIEFSGDGSEIGVGTLAMDDPDGTDEIAGGLQAKLMEGTTLLTDGFISAQDKTRVGGSPARDDTYQISDANRVFYGKRFVNRSRPSESDRARVLAFAGLDLPAADTTMVLNSNLVTLPAKKYTGSDWLELMTDVREAAGKIIFIHDLADDTGRCLHSHLETQGHTCGLSISDVLGTADATTFYPRTPNRNRTEASLSNDVYGRDQANRVSIASDSTSIALHDAAGLLHQSVIEFEATSQSDLDAKTANSVTENKNETDIYSCVIGPLDETALALIRVGDRITVDSQAMAASSLTIRIAHMNLTPWRDEKGQPRAGLWDADLELDQAIRLRGGGGRRPSSGGRPVTRNELLQTMSPLVCIGPNGLITDTFNRDPVSPGWGDATGGYTWSGAPATASTNGSAGVLSTASALVTDVRAHQGPVSLTGLVSPFLIDITISFSCNRTLADYDAAWQAWTTTNPLYSWGIVPIWIGSSSDNFVRLSLGGGPGAATTSEIQVVFSNAGLNDVWPVVFSGSGTLQVKQSVDLMEIIYDGITVATYVDTFVAADAISPQFYALGRTPEGGEPGGAPAQPTAGRVDIISQVDWVAVVGYPECIPAVLQEVNDEHVAFGDGSTTAYSTLGPYTPGSLRIKVDDLPEPEIVEDDPSAGTFHFLAAPYLGEDIRASYRGA